MIGLAAAGLIGACTASLSAGTAFLEFTRPAMGTEIRIVVSTADSACARATAARAFDRIAQIEAVLSDYDPGSELSSLSRLAAQGDWVPVGHDLWTVLEAAHRWSHRTDGAFDVTVGPLTRLWRRARRRGSIPEDEGIARVMPRVGFQRLELDPVRRAVRFGVSGMRLDVGALAKGYAAEVALDVLRDGGLGSALVDAGGDLAIGDPPPGRSGWRVAVPAITPQGALGTQMLCLARVAVASSGDTFQFVEIDGVRYSHVVDPRSGRAVAGRRVTTVFAPDAMDADALASALSVLELQPGMKLVEGLTGTRARVFQAPDRDGGAWSVTGPSGLDVAPYDVDCPRSRRDPPERPS